MTIKFDYFKPSNGKWYTEAFLMLPDVNLNFQAFEKVTELLKDESQPWPGLSTRGNFDVLVTAYTEQGESCVLLKAESL